MPDVFDSGPISAWGDLRHNADHATAVALVAAPQPPAGTFDTCLAEGMVRLGAQEP